MIIKLGLNFKVIFYVVLKILFTTLYLFFQFPCLIKHIVHSDFILVVDMLPLTKAICGL